MSTNVEQVTAALNVVMSVAEAIRDLGQVPSGELYAHLAGHLDINDFHAVIGTLVRAGLVRDTNHLLVWIGPAKEVK